jgi:hypothetical protein
VQRSRGLVWDEVRDVVQLEVVVQERPAAPGADHGDLQQGWDQAKPQSAGVSAHLVMMDLLPDNLGEAVDKDRRVSLLGTV